MKNNNLNIQSTSGKNIENNNKSLEFENRVD